MDVDETTFEEEVLRRSEELPVVVDFWAEWCGPCRMLGPVLEREAEARDGQVRLVKVNVDTSPGLTAKYGVRGIPAVKAFKKGHVVDEFAGVRPPQAVASFFDALTGPSPVERLLEELRGSGESPDVVAAIEAGDHERALELLLAELEQGDEEERERVRQRMLALFDELGVQHPLSLRYRRRLASLLF
jgi:putative thioredoxin